MPYLFVLFIELSFSELSLSLELSAIPRLDIERSYKEIKLIRGEVTSPINVKPGCRFAPRCELYTEECGLADPEYKEVSPGHFVACYHVNNK